MSSPQQKVLLPSQQNRQQSRTIRMANWLPKNDKNIFMDSKIPSQEYSSATTTKKCALMNEQQWAQLNEQIKQICLDCSKQFVQHEIGEINNKRLVNDRRITTQTTTMSNNSPHVNPRQGASIAPQTFQLPPTAKKASGFSLPRLLLPKGKEKQLRRPSNQQQQELPEQHSPTTTTSAYGTGGTDTGQESPVERNQQMHEKNSTMGNVGLTAFGGGEQQKQQSRENIVVKGGRQKSVKFDTSSISLIGNKAEDIVQLPGGVFYTSAERLAQTLEAQQRLLRKELQQEEIHSKMAIKPSHQLQRQQPLDKTKKHLIRVPPIPIPSPSHESQSPPILHFPPAPSNSSNFANRPSPMPNLRMRNPSAEELSPRPVHKTLLGRPPSLQHVVPPNSPKSTVAMAFGNREEEENVRKEQMFAANFKNNICNQNNKATTITRGRQMHLKPTLDNIFAYKPATTNVENQKEKGQEQQPKVVVIRQGFGHQPRRKSKSPVKQPMAISSQSQQQSAAELEWVIKRRPDGTRYVTRRPARKQKQQCWSAVVKARREQSLLRERYQSGAVSTTTDDDGAVTGNEMAHQASRLWMREQRRRHKGKTTTAFDAAMAIERNKRECLYGDEDGESWMGMGGIMEANNNNSDFGGKQQILPRLNTDLRQLNPQQQIAGGRGHSLPGQAIFSITTV